MLRTRRGLGISTDHQEVVDLVDNFTDQLVGFRSGAGKIADALLLDPCCILTHCYAALTNLMVDRLDGPILARSLLKKAQKLKHRAGPYEIDLLNAIELWADGRPFNATVQFERILAKYPRDLLTLMILQTLYFRSGNTLDLLRTTEMVAHENLDSPEIYGMMAFAYCEVGRFHEAEKWAREGVSCKRDEFGAHHSMAHVFEMEGRVEEGRDWLLGHCDTWDHASAWTQSHLWWHLSVFMTDLGDTVDAIGLLPRVWSDDDEWGPDKDRTRYPINGIHILWRLSTLGLKTSHLWPKLGARLRNRSKDPVEPFPSILYLYALRKAGYLCEAEDLLDSIKERSERELAQGNRVWSDLALPTAQGLLAYLEGNAEECIRLLLPLSSSEWIALGHSQAQRDILAITLSECLRKTGQDVPLDTNLMRRALRKAVH